MIKGLHYMNFVEEKSLPTFQQFQIKKIPIHGKTIDAVKPSFVLCFVDQSFKILADNSIKGEQELVSLVNSTISHEMRNPLNIIVNQCKIIRMFCEQFFQDIPAIESKIGAELFAKLNEFYLQIVKCNEICCTSSDKLSLNVEDLLSFAQIKAGTFFKNIQSFNIHRCIQDITHIQQYQADSKNISIATHFYGFPKKNGQKVNEREEIREFDDRTMMIETDELRLKQILTNLQTNALKFTKDNGEIHIICQYIRAQPANVASAKVDRDMAQHFIDFSGSSDVESVAASYIGSEQVRFDANHNLEEIFVPNEKSDKIVVSITDTGVGISDAQRVKLFKLFGCIQNVEHENNQGIGLGLVISEKIVRAFDGMIGMRSKKGVGSQFSFSILLKDQNGVAEPKKKDQYIDQVEDATIVEP